MSDLSNKEKRTFETLLDMGGGYVLNFSNRTFFEFILDSTGRDIYDDRYSYSSGSKANRLRAFWNEEPNHVVGKLMNDLLDYGAFKAGHPLLVECHRIIARLLQSSPVPEMDALTAITAEKDFEALAKEVRETIERNQPEAGLDRLHTFVIKYVRSLCAQRGIAATRDKALHSLFGEYVKHLLKAGHIESVMTERILKSSVSVLESFNHVRNDHSFAHDNPILNYDESLLIFNYVTISLRFLQRLEDKIRNMEGRKASESETGEISF
jgi:hypothetical protein